jgi:hypothetical protein
MACCHGKAAGILQKGGLLLGCVVSSGITLPHECANQGLLTCLHTVGVLQLRGKLECWCVCALESALGAGLASSPLIRQAAYVLAGVSAQVLFWKLSYLHVTLGCVCLEGIDT